jgi:phosphonoacetaldehyde hydrolase
MMEVNRKDAARQGYEPESTVCASDVPAGRPHPFMCLQNMINLQVSPVSGCVKVDDTVPGVEEGLNAGMWTVGLAMSGNEVGLPLKDVMALHSADREARRQRAYARMRQCGAHYVVDSSPSCCVLTHQARRHAIDSGCGCSFWQASTRNRGQYG